MIDFRKAIEINQGEISNNESDLINLLKSEIDIIDLQSQESNKKLYIKFTNRDLCSFGSITKDLFNRFNLIVKAFEIINNVNRVWIIDPSQD